MQSPSRNINATNGANSSNHNGSNSSAASEQDTIRRTAHVLRQLYHRETHWLSTRTADQSLLLTQQGQLNLNEQMHYGEVAFVLLRLKPCAIIDFAGDRTQLADYIVTVIEPTIRDLNALGAPAKNLAATDFQSRAADSNSAWYPRPFQLTCTCINGQLSSPEVASWTGAFVLYDEMWTESATWAKTNLLDPLRTTVSEDTLARGLDYPGSLPTTSEDMMTIVPVSYLGRMK
ncbi:hypothetical protein H4S07_000786 [Coemansia furcata]|uniref:Uncharacterized protein n=1 Tax=Coemansia furcata TaxID=417177 RepID=A0ACC1LPR1_9FUNG|nr:hypothetical protein H4S07_000786 [Coemansia furcata]